MRNNSYVLNLFNTHTVQPKSIASGPNSLHLLISSQFIFGGNSQSRNDRFKRTCDIISTCFSFSLRLMGIDCKLQLWRNSSRRISLQTDTSDVCKISCQHSLAYILGYIIPITAEFSPFGSAIHLLLFVVPQLDHFLVWYLLLILIGITAWQSFVGSKCTSLWVRILSNTLNYTPLSFNSLSSSRLLEDLFDDFLMFKLI